MSSLLESLYLHGGVPLQNVMVSMKGLLLERERHGGRYRASRLEIGARRHWDAEKFAAYQEQQLRRLIDVCSNHVPHYRNWLASLGSPGSFRLEDLAQLPLLDKRTVREDSRRFVDQRLNLRKLLTIQTTGTTGTPLRIYTDASARQLNYAFFDHYLSSVGIDPRAPHAVFGGRVLDRQDRKGPPFWRHSRFQHALLFSSYHMEPKTLPSYANALVQFGPDYIDGYPSALYTLATHLLTHGGPTPRPRAIVTSSETLFPEQRTAIEAAFGCPVYDQYGTAEMALFVGQCPLGRYHVRPDYGIVEVLRDGRPAAPGEVGEVVCTGFVNPVMPLLRYRVGDRAVVSNERCGCGSSAPVFERIEGRCDDVIVTPSGRRVGRLSPVLKGFPLMEAQYVQEDISHVLIKVVPSPEYDPSCETAIRAEVIKRLGDDMLVQVQVVDSIARGRGGKFQSVVSHIHS